MTDLTIGDIFELPPSIPRCIVKIQDFDDEQTLQAPQRFRATMTELQHRL